MRNRRIRHTDENSVKIDALHLYNDVREYAKKSEYMTFSSLLAEYGIDGSVIANSTRNYWIKFGTEPKELRGSAFWGVKYNRQAYHNGFTKGWILEERYKKICDICHLNYDDYLLDKPKPIAKKPADDEKVIYTHKYDDDLKDIKELLRTQNILLKKLVDALL